MLENKTKEQQKVLIEVFDKINKLAAAGLGLVAALAWNDAIKALFEVIFPQPDQNIWAQFIYAVIITLIVVLITVYLARYLRKIKKLFDNE